MKSANPALLSLLSDAREFWMCDLYTLTLVDGTVLRYTSADVDVSAWAPAYGWGFANSLQSWVATNATLTANASTLTMTTTAASPFMQSPASLSINGAQNPFVRARVRKLAGSSAFEGRVYYSTGSHGNTAGYVKQISHPGIETEWTVLEWDMRLLTAGGTDWTDNTITRIRIDLTTGTNVNDIWEIDWVEVGGYAQRTFAHDGPQIGRSRTRIALGTAVDSLDLTISAQAGTLLSGLPWLQAITNGALDGATLDLERAFSPAPGVPPHGSVLLFSGRVSDTTTDSLTARVIVRSHMELLNTPLPRNLYQPPCGFSLYDSGCGVSRASFGVNSSVSSGSTRQVINCALAQASGYFDIGELVFTSGANLGVRRTVKSYTPGVINLAYPLPKSVAVGDTFTIYPGCDKRLTTCDTKFANASRFRGTPFVPVPETSL